MTSHELNEIIQSFSQLKKDQEIEVLTYDAEKIRDALSYRFKLPCIHHVSKPPCYLHEIPYMFFYHHDIFFYQDINHQVIFLIKDPRRLNIIKQGYLKHFKVQLISIKQFHEIKDKFHLYYKIYDIIQKIQQTKKDTLQFKWHYMLISNIFIMALKMQASDIHLIKTATHSEVYFRIQGYRTYMFSLDIIIMDHLLRRLKVLANLEINNHQDPQDGLFIWKDEFINETFRLATMPTSYGEQMMLRMIQQESMMKTIDQLGFSEIQSTYLKQQLKKKQGLIFVSGSTGSGKTTTLYACLKVLKEMPIHIVTLEDPIEIKMEHISQMQLDQQKNLLKHIMRYDPDVIMIGEIRDEASAKASIEASLSGHLVLASIHVNHPKDIFKRMKQFLIDQTMIEEASPLVMHHQLIPLICHLCHGKGCIHCMFKGHEKRQLIVDMMHFINHTWYQKGDAYDISLKHLKSMKLIDETTYQQYQLEL
jgi:type II secretory ATPase GspE/PulE/Tfp pilus assembly ATPase PilB-like protein